MAFHREEIVAGKVLDPFLEPRRHTFSMVVAIILEMLLPAVSRVWRTDHATVLNLLAPYLEQGQRMHLLDLVGAYLSPPST